MSRSYWLTNPVAKLTSLDLPGYPDTHTIPSPPISRTMLLPFYTIRYVEIDDPFLCFLYTVSVVSMALLTIGGAILGSYSFVEREDPDINVKMWQDYSLDGSWWPSPRPIGVSLPQYCNELSYISRGSSTNPLDGTVDTTVWGSQHIQCLRPLATAGTYFFASPNSLSVATSIALGPNPQYNTSEVYVYEGIETATIMFQPSYTTSHAAVPHASGCVARLPNGSQLPSRYSQLYPDEDYGAGFLQLSVDDILRGANRTFDHVGALENAPLRLSGLEIAAYVDIRNYNEPYLWPFDGWNPFGFVRNASDVRCEIRFEVLREDFTPIQWYYDRTTPIALQHGLSIRILGRGSVGVFSWALLLQSIVLGVGAFGIVQSILDQYWYFFHAKSDDISHVAFKTIRFTTNTNTPSDRHVTTDAKKES
eukprot:m.166452 g.166452  ORF g.166452 m.166452 type:complete len:421 (-) comp31429_c0_seq1:90-1352(-)